VCAVALRLQKGGVELRAGSATLGRAFELDHVSFRIGDIDRRPFTLGAITLLDRAGGVAVASELLANAASSNGSIRRQK